MQDLPKKKRDSAAKHSYKKKKSESLMERIKLIWLGCVILLLGVMGWLVVDRVVSPTGYFISGVNYSDESICSDIKLVADYKINEPIRVDKKTVKINPDRINEFDLPDKYKELFSLNREPILYNYTEGRDNIVIIGDSYSEGSGVQYNETYSYFLSKKIDMNVINLGIGGYNTKLEIERLKQMGMKYNPKIIILQYCNNDIENTNEFWKLISGVLNKLENQGLNCNKGKIDGSNEVVSKTMTFYWKEIIKKNRKMMLNKNIYLPLNQLGNLSSIKDIKVFLLLLPAPKYQKFPILNLSDQYGFNIINIQEELNIEIWSPPITVSDENEHFSAQTHKRLADLISGKIISNQQKKD